MQAAERAGTLTVEEYLAGERQSEVRHEYLAGVVHAMAGASEEHNLIAGNIYAALRSHLAGRSCRVFMADMKLRLEVAHADVFYYPDVIVSCDPRDTDRYFKRYPKVLIEVLSPETERTDRREKFLSYTQIESLEEYVLVAQERREVTLYSRDREWRPEVLSEAGAQLVLSSLELSLPLAAVYEGVKV